jgi:hypothetical protein
VKAVHRCPPAGLNRLGYLEVLERVVAQRRIDVLSVDDAQAREDITRVGEALSWHGGLTIDYMSEREARQYIECNPRTVEPANAMASGVNIPELQHGSPSGRTSLRRLG